MRKMILAAALLAMSTSMMAQTEPVINTMSPLQPVTSQDWATRFEKEIVGLQADITSLKTKLSADKGNTTLKLQVKQKQDDLKVAKANLKASKVALKQEAAADKEVAKAKAQVAKLQAKKDKAEAAVAKAEQNVVKAQDAVKKAEQKVAKAEQGVAKAQQKVDQAKQGVAKAQDNVAKAQDNVVKAKDNVATISDNHDINDNIIKAAEQKRSAAFENLRKSITLRADGTSGR